MSMIASQRQIPALRRSLFAAAVAAGLLAAVGCSGGYDIAPLPNGELAEGDRLCRDDMQPSQGDLCTQDCLTATCAGGTGRRICTCEGGVFLQCACLPPADWPYKDVPSAPYCDRISGRPQYLATDLCTGEGRQCVSSTNPALGCTCTKGAWQCGSSASYGSGAEECEALGRGVGALMDSKPCADADMKLWQLCITRDFNPEGTSPRGCVCNDNGQQVWQCGATNRWYRAE